jgi:hypothetical protein
MKRRSAIAGLLVVAIAGGVFFLSGPSEQGPRARDRAAKTQLGNDSENPATEPEASFAEADAGEKTVPEPPAAPATLTGRVTEAGLAVARAEVRITLRGDAPDREDCAHEDVQPTSGSGSFESAPLCPGQYDVVASSHGKRALHALRLGGGDRVEIVLSLQAEGAIEVSVFLPDGGRASQATVTFSHQASGVLSQSSTDESGVARLAPAAIGRWTVEAWREDTFRESDATDVRARATARVRLVLDSQLLVTGEVVDETGAPHDGVKLRLLDAKAVAREASALSKSESTDGGTFTLGPVVRGSYLVQARGGERIETRVEVPSSPIRLVVPRGADVEVQLLQEGAPTAGIAAVTSGDFTDGSGSPDGGPIVFHSVPLGPATVVGGGLVERTKHAGLSASAEVNVRRPVTRVSLEVSTEEIAGISGRCSLTSGHALPKEVAVIALGESVGWNPHVTKEPPRGALTRMAGHFAMAACDRDGGFAVGGLTAGRYRLLVEAEQSGDKVKLSQEATAPSTGVDVRVPGLAWFRFRVVDPSGQPVRRWGFNAEEIEDHPDGRYEVEHYRDEEYALSIHAPGYVTTRVRIGLQRGKDLDLGEIALSRESYVLSGQVVSAADQSPVAGAEVYTMQYTTTDESGAFELGPMARRNEELTVAHPHFQTAKLPLRSTDPQRLTIQLQPAGWIRGQVLTRSGAVPPRLKATAWSHEATATGDVKDGLFEIGPLEPGSWVVRLDGDDDDDVSAFDALRVEVRTGAPTDAAFVERAGGTTFEVEQVSSAGEPIIGRVYLSPNKDVEQPWNAGLFGFAVARGIYRFRAVPPGQWTLISSNKPRATQTVVVGAQLAPRVRFVVPGL